MDWTWSTYRFQGAAPAVTSTIAGHTSIVHMTSPAVTPHLKDGSGKRSSALPDVPTLEESGLPGIEAEFIMLVVAPAGTPKHVIALLNGQIVRILKLPDVKERLATLGFDPAGSTAEELAAKIQTETRKSRLRSPRSAFGGLIRRRKLRRAARLRRSDTRGIADLGASRC
jgi:tripartite-type tricarboxylate transporter receptor subunit TctC